MARKQQSGKLRIVVVDDEALMLELYEELIRGLFKAATVLLFQDAEKAMQELTREEPDLLITDMFRPRLDGWEMLGLLAGKNVKYPILIISGGAKEKDVMRCAGPDLNVTFLQKPWKAEELSGILSRLLDPRRRA